MVSLQHRFCADCNMYYGLNCQEYFEFREQSDAVPGPGYDSFYITSQNLLRLSGRLKSLRSSGAIWRHRMRSTLIQCVAWSGQTLGPMFIVYFFVNLTPGSIARWRFHQIFTLFAIFSAILFRLLCVHISQRFSISAIFGHFQKAQYPVPVLSTNFPVNSFKCTGGWQKLRLIQSNKSHNACSSGGHFVGSLKEIIFHHELYWWNGSLVFHLQTLFSLQTMAPSF